MAECPLLLSVVDKGFHGLSLSTGTTQRILRVWSVPMKTLLAQIFLAISSFFHAFLSAITSPPSQGVLIPSAVRESVCGDGGFNLSDSRTGGRIGFLGSQAGFGWSGCMPLGHDPIPYLRRHFCIHFRWPCLALAGTSKQGTRLALFLQSVKQLSWVCQRVHMIVPLIFALSSRSTPANWVHSSPSLSLNSAHWRSFLTDVAIFAAPMFSFLSLFFLFFVVVVFSDSALVSASLSVPSLTALKDAGRLVLKLFKRMMLWLAEKSKRELSTSSLSLAWVQLSRYSPGEQYIGIAIIAISSNNSKQYFTNIY